MREDRWQHVLHAALLLEEPCGDVARKAQVQLVLGSLLEVFPSSLDPVEDFEGFSVRKLAQALQRALE